MEIKQMRRDIRLSQIEMAKRIGISQSQLCKCEMGYSSLSEEEKVRFLNIYYDELRKPKSIKTQKVSFAIGVVDADIIEKFKRLKGDLSAPELFERMVINYEISNN